jgi:hypothetical protein
MQQSLGRRDEGTGNILPGNVSLLLHDLREMKESSAGCNQEWNENANEPPLIYTLSRISNRHPKSDGKDEEVNPTVNPIMRRMINKKETRNVNEMRLFFCYSSVRSAFISKSLFALYVHNFVHILRLHDLLKND